MMICCKRMQGVFIYYWIGEFVLCVVVNADFGSDLVKMSSLCSESVLKNKWFTVHAEA